MTTAFYLVTGRLTRALGPTRDRPPVRPVPSGRSVNYSILRLGLVPPARVAAARPAPTPAGPAAQAQTTPATEPPEPRKKCTFRLPESLACRLRAFSLAARRFQYAVVADALQQHLAAVIVDLDPAEKDLVASLAKPPEPPVPALRCDEPQDSPQDLPDPAPWEMQHV